MPSDFCKPFIHTSCFQIPQSTPLLERQEKNRGLFHSASFSRGDAPVYGHCFPKLYRTPDAERASCISRSPFSVTFTPLKFQGAPRRELRLPDLPPEHVVEPVVIRLHYYYYQWTRAIEMSQTGSGRLL